jgi:hypothetical protein
MARGGCKRSDCACSGLANGEHHRANALQRATASLGQPELPAITRDNYIGMKLTVPIFEGFYRHYRIQEAQADADEKEQNLRDIKRRVASGVWSSYETLQSASENLRNADTLLRSAQESFEAIRYRYQSGVRSMTWREVIVLASRPLNSGRTSASSGSSDRCASYRC